MFTTARPLWQRVWEPPAARIFVADGPSRPLGFLHASRAAEVAARAPGARELTAAAADEVLAGQFRLCGARVRLQRPLGFGFDPVTGHRWPSSNGKRLDYRAGGDPKWAWELNRLQHLPLLAAAWFLTGEQRYAEAAAGDLRDWLDATTVGRGIAWTSGFEAGIRAISIALCHDAFRGEPFVDARLHADTARSLWQHGRFIRRDPSTHSSANNHRIGELAGLAAIGLIVTELREAKAWCDEALRGLAHEAERQIRPDGTSAEQSFAYHLSVLELLLTVVALADARGVRRPPAIVAALARSADALWAQLAPGEPPPRYGDRDEGLATRLDGEVPADTSRVAAWLTSALGHDGAAALTAAAEPTAVWLFGERGARTAESTPRREAAGDVVLGDAGLVVLRRQGMRVVVDAGPLGHGTLAAHGHADALQVTLADEDGELIVDPGVGSYYSRPDLRAAFRGSGFHPTVIVDEVDQSVSGGPFLWSEHAHARLLTVDLDSGVVVVEHDGYLRLPDPVQHRRGVLILEDGVTLVVDRLRSRGPHRFSQRWPLAADLDAIVAESTEVRVSSRAEPRLSIHLAASAESSLRLARGEEQPPLGWDSPGLEQFRPATICLWEPVPVAEVVLAALLYPVVDEPWPRPELTLEANATDAIVSFATAAGWRSFVVNLEDSLQPFVETPTAVRA